MQHLLAAGADPDGWHDNTGWTPLSLAAWHGHDEVVAALIDGGAQINRGLRTVRPGVERTGEEGWNVLHRLVARMSVESSSEVWTDDVRNQEEAWSPLWEGLFKRLVECGGDATAPDAKGRSPRVLVEEYGMVQVGEQLGVMWPWEKVGYGWWCA